MPNILDQFLVRCLHRHSIDEHPSCFAEGAVIDKRKDKDIPWYKMPGMKIGYIDIETDGLKADFSTMLSWSLKEKDGETAYSAINKKEIFNKTYDKRLVEDLVNEMSKYKILVSYYGTGFDLKYIRSKALHYGLPFPEYGEIFHFDLYYTVKSKLCLSRNSLDAACDYLGIEGKTPIKREFWREAKYGDVESLDEVVKHNIGDVEILEQLHNKLTPSAKWTKKSI